MKILNRPMFRMGGPIKEGIMNGIQEPRRIGYAGKGTVSVADQAKAFENIFTTPQVTQEQVNMFAKRGTPSNLNIGTPKISSFEKMQKNNQFGNQDPTIVPDITIEDKIKSYTPEPTNPFRPLIDYTEKVNIYTDEDGNKRDRTTGRIITDTDYSKVVTEPRGPQELGSTTRKEVKPDGKLPGDTKEPPLTKKERTNNILEMLGYDKAKKNALYDAMINAGQRISRTGLGADNLVSDVIADTSRSYDKPEKLREAANLMDVQQQLKLDQIEASKTGGATAQNYQYFLDRGYDEKTAARKAEGLATNLLEAKSIGIEKQKLQGDKLTEYVAQSLIGMNNDDFKNAEYKGTINSKDHKTVSEFAASTDFGGAGVYAVKGRVIELDGKGNILTEQIVSSSTSDKKWWNLSD